MAYATLFDAEVKNAGAGAVSLDAICHWLRPEGLPQIASPLPVEEMACFAAPGYWYSYNQTAPGPVLAADGTFISGEARKVPSGQMEHYPAVIWRLPENDSGPLQRIGPAGNMLYSGPDNLFWSGFDMPGEPQALRVWMNGQELPALPDFFACNVHATAGNAVLYAFSSLPGREAFIHYRDEWRPAPGVDAVDMTADGLFINHSQSGLHASATDEIQAFPVSRHAPGLDAAWNVPELHLLDASPGGWILAYRRFLGSQDNSPAALLPLRVSGHWSDGTHIHSEAAGADNTSVGATAVDPAAVDRLWLLAGDEDGPPASYLINAPLNGNTPLTLSHPSLRFNTGTWEHPRTAP